MRKSKIIIAAIACMMLMTACDKDKNTDNANNSVESTDAVQTVEEKKNKSDEIDLFENVKLVMMDEQHPFFDASYPSGRCFVVNTDECSDELQNNVQYKLDSEYVTANGATIVVTAQPFGGFLIDMENNGTLPDNMTKEFIIDGYGECLTKDKIDLADFSEIEDLAYRNLDALIISEEPDEWSVDKRLMGQTFGGWSDEWEIISVDSVEKHSLWGSFVNDTGVIDNVYLFCSVNYTAKQTSGDAIGTTEMFTSYGYATLHNQLDAIVLMPDDTLSLNILNKDTRKYELVAYDDIKNISADGSEASYCSLGDNTMNMQSFETMDDFIGHIADNHPLREFIKLK